VTGFTVVPGAPSTDHGPFVGQTDVTANSQPADVLLAFGAAEASINQKVGTISLGEINFFSRESFVINV
jgi:hypothetical protein